MNQSIKTDINTYFTKEDTRVIKGIAIILMLIHICIFSGENDRKWVSVPIGGISLFSTWVHLGKYVFRFSFFLADMEFITVQLKENLIWLQDWRMYISAIGKFLLYLYLWHSHSFPSSQLIVRTKLFAMYIKIFHWENSLEIL